jgi:hypothetical protein
LYAPASGAERAFTVLDRLTPQLGFNPLSITERLQKAAGKIAYLRKQEAEKTGLLAAYRAQFEGYNSSHYEHERSSYLSELSMQFRIEAEKQGKKVTEGLVDEFARSHPQYKKWLAEKHAERETMYKLEAELAQIRADLEEARMEREDALVTSRLNEELIRFVRAEMGIQ